MQCVGRNSDDKVACGFKVVCEFVNNVQSSTSCGWVLKEVSGEAHECANGERHDLNISLAQVKTNPKSARAMAQLGLDPFKSLGWTLKNAYLGGMCIDKALREKAFEENLEPKISNVGTLINFEVNSPSQSGMNCLISRMCC